MNLVTLVVVVVVLASSFSINSKLAYIMDELRKLNEKLPPR